MSLLDDVIIGWWAHYSRWGTVLEFNSNINSKVNSEMNSNTSSNTNLNMVQESNDANMTCKETFGHIKICSSWKSIFNWPYINWSKSEDRINKEIIQKHICEYNQNLKILFLLQKLYYKNTKIQELINSLAQQVFGHEFLIE